MKAPAANSFNLLTREAAGTMVAERIKVKTFNLICSALNDKRTSAVLSIRLFIEATDFAIVDFVTATNLVKTPVV
jgi:hypothetical protein